MSNSVWGRLAQYLVSFETKGADRLPVDSETHVPETDHETPLGSVTPRLARFWKKLSSGYGHATPFYYWMIAIVLAIVTLVEVWILNVNFTRNTFVFAALVLSAMKFVLVVALYMHLRFDNRAYTWVFMACMLLGILVFTATLALTTYFGMFQN